MDHRLTSWSPFSSRGKEEEGDAEDLLRCIFPISPPPLPPPPDSPLIRIYIHTSPLFSTGKKERGGRRLKKGFQTRRRGEGEEKKKKEAVPQRSSKGRKGVKKFGGKGESLHLSLSFLLDPPLPTPVNDSSEIPRFIVLLYDDATPQLLRKDSSVWLDFSPFFPPGFPPRPWE